MKYFDVFNGDADGLCALIQLRKHTPCDTKLITGVKRDIQLLKKINTPGAANITVLDISFEKNADDVQRLLDLGAKITYIDHHRTGKLIKHPNLKTNIDLSADTCTSLIVDKHLNHQYQAWALTGAFGDNLTKKTWQLGLQSGFNEKQLNALNELGTLLNYNGYGATLDDLFFHPAILYQHFVAFDSPFDVTQQDNKIFQTLKKGYQQDMERAEKSDILFQNNAVKIIGLPNEKWARRVSGVFVNKLSQQTPDSAHACITDNGNDTYTVSIRAPLNNKQGADILASKFPTGGGRKAAAGINRLPKNMLPTFIKTFNEFYQ